MIAVTLALGGDCLADIAVLRGEPAVYGSVASDATVSRTIATLAGDASAVLTAIDTARAKARRRAWALAGADAPDHATNTRRPLIVDLDATLVGSYSDKEQAAPTFKRGYGFHPLCAFVDHGGDARRHRPHRPTHPASPCQQGTLGRCRQRHRNPPGRASPGHS